MSTTPDLTGRRIRHYEVTSYITSGGMAAVYRALDTQHERMVALKVLPTRLAEDDTYKARFEREAETAESLKHPHIVPVYDHGSDGDLSYVVMQLLDGGTLTERLKVRQRTAEPLPSLGEIAGLLEQVAAALDFAHSQRVIHRDIKPSNIMFDTQGNAYIVDFGIAKLLTTAAESLTETGVPMGTPSYMSPEQWRGEKPTPRVDQYALGVVVYRLVTGHVPFRADSPYALMQKHSEALLPPIENYPRALSESLHAVIARAMAKAADDRYDTASAFAAAFKAAVANHHGRRTDFLTFSLPPRQDALPAQPADDQPTAGTAILPRTEGALRGSRRWWVPLVLLVAAVLLGGVGVAVLMGGDTDADSAASGDSGRTLQLAYEGATLVIHNDSETVLDIRGMRFETGADTAYFDTDQFGPGTTSAFQPGRCMVVSLVEVAPGLPDYCADTSRQPLLYGIGTAQDTYFVWDREIVGVQQFRVTLDGDTTLATCPLDAGTCTVALPTAREVLPTPTPRPLEPPTDAEAGGLLLLYTDRAALTILNTSDRMLDISGVELALLDGSAAFDAEWFGDQTARNFAPGACIFIGLTQEDAAPPDFCGPTRVLQYNTTTAPRYHFVWLPDANPDDTFQLMQRGRFVATCPLAGGRCFVDY
jgi:hypothetical protein